MWVDYRGSLNTVYNDGEISTCGEIIEVHSVQSTMMGRSQHVGRSSLHWLLIWAEEPIPNYIHIRTYVFTYTRTFQE